MSKDKIPQYHPSYTEEENRAVHEYFETATVKSLVQTIWDFCEVYPEESRERIKASLNQLRTELAQRLYMEKCYKKLVQCRDKWKRCRDDYERYAYAEKLRQAYAEYKKKPDEKFHCIGRFEGFFEKYRETLCLGYSDETIRRLLTPEKEKSGKKRPVFPDKYYGSMEDIPVDKNFNGDVLESLGVDELKKILLMLLSYVDYEGEKSPADVIILFLTRKYSHTTHKKKIHVSEQHFPNFSSTITLSTSIQNCKALLKEIGELKIEVEKLDKETKKKKTKNKI